MCICRNPCKSMELGRIYCIYCMRDQFPVLKKIIVILGTITVIDCTINTVVIYKHHTFTRSIFQLSDTIQFTKIIKLLGIFVQGSVCCQEYCLAPLSKYSSWDVHSLSQQRIDRALIITLLIPTCFFRMSTEPLNLYMYNSKTWMITT